jgi:serine/threonine protein kinase
MSDDTPDWKKKRLEEALDELARATESGTDIDIEAFFVKYADIRDVLEPIVRTMFSLNRLKGLLHNDLGHSDHEVELKPGNGFGDFKIIRELGRGGMGLVYEAIQSSLNRRVALKILSTAARLEKREQKRFQREAEIAAKLRHDHIVPVYGVGNQDGVLFITMQFVEGHSLVRMIRALRIRRRLDEPDESLDDVMPLAAQLERGNDQDGAAHGDGPYIRAMAALGEQAASALAYAHGQGVYHRDIKPGNLLIDLDGRLWVVDFGLAQAARAADETQTMTRVGTLPYLPPEQLNSSPPPFDERGDIYALGISLYEALTLYYPFARDQSLQTRIVKDDPPTPRSLRPTIPQDLEKVILKAMARDPDERYQTARDLADDLRRFLDGQPVHARPLTRLQRLRRMAYRRRRTLAFVGVAVLLGLVLGLTTGGGLWIRAENRNRMRTLQAAQSAFRKAREFRHKPGEEKEEYDRLRVLLPFVEQIADTAPLDHPLHEEVANFTLRLAEAEHRIGYRQSAIEHFKLAEERFERILQRDPKRHQLRMQLAMLMGNRASYATEKSELPEAERTMATAFAHIEVLLKQEHDKAEYLARKCMLFHQQSRLYLICDDVAGAIRVETEALKIARDLLERFPERHALSYMRLVWIMTYMAEFRSMLGDLAGAAEALEEGMRYDRILADQFPKSPTDRSTTISVSAFYAEVVMAQDRWDEANVILGRTIDELRGLVERHAEIWAFRIGLFSAIYNRAAIHYHQGNDEKARESIREAMHLFVGKKVDSGNVPSMLRFVLAQPSPIGADDPLIKSWLADLPSTTPEATRRRISGMGALRDGKYAEAAQLLANPSGQRDEIIGAEYARAIALLRMGDRKNAELQFQEAEKTTLTHFIDISYVHILRDRARREFRAGKP